jgi:CheY-like chemotaxis protein
VHPDRDGNDETWAAFDAALRSVARPGPDPSLRNRCLPETFDVRDANEARETSTLETLPSKLRVLVVDDEPNIRRLLQFHLARAGYEVETATDGLEALEQVRLRRPDILILDVMMPGPDGFRVLEALKDDPRTADIQVLMLSAKSRDDDIRHGWQSGNDFYMTKPFNPEELRTVVDRIAAVLGTPENPPPQRRWSK